jgi:hypothetical protein
VAKRLYKIAGDDGSSSSLSSCPTVLGEESDNVTVIVQGYELDGKTAGVLSIPAGETAVRIPRDVLVRAAGRLTHNG